MPTFVCATRGTSEREIRQAKSFLLEAKDFEEAKQLALEELASAEEDVDGADSMRVELDSTFGDEWFVQELAVQEDWTVLRK